MPVINNLLWYGGLKVPFKIKLRNQLLIYLYVLNVNK